MTIKTPNGDKIIDPTTTEPSKPYLAQKVVGGTEYYPCETSSGEGVAIKGNGASYKISEGAILKLTYDPSALTQVKIYDENNVLKETYNNPTTNTIINVVKGGKIEWVHDASWVWIYRTVEGSNVWLNDNQGISSCFSNVPLNASGLAEIEVNFLTSIMHDTLLNFRVSNGWIKSSYCYPYI